ncbi:LysM peptidoglycan-binding domain-containing protein [Dysgonomonas sp. Marseille-P4677]|uniref:LysM peptidoglycan-binding domain-containing protein n=1 Tax=Dysgonomonas sp. Marseille-P4677 TaxID=2364790 RepID=UPI001913BA63|nr:LysM peptidoglycan-binding domain-containing protein [Dysgonomonas sp. Marseille-P4677]MBK5722269.1 LysM peptidoglycan-binding domain-containing protein [Dysgonomonas sp. Marseille-P4677]
MMNLQSKYRKVIDSAQESQIEDLSITENNEVLYISGTTSEYIKEKLWDLYNQIDQDMRSGDMVLDIKVKDEKPEDEEGEIEDSQFYEIKSGDSLSKIAELYPGLTWQELFEANKDVIKDPDIIYPGQKIKIPK